MRRFWLYLTFATLIGVAFLWLAARDLPWADVDSWAQTADAGHIALWSIVFMAGYALCHLARVVRWYELVRPLGAVEARVVHRVCAVGFAAILLLPFRLGEFVRPYLLSRRSDFTMPALLGTVVVERVVDGLVVTGMLFVTLATYSGDASPLFARTTGLISAAIFVPALLVCLLALRWREPTLAVLSRIGGVVSASLTQKILVLLETFIDGFQALLAAHALSRFMFATAVYWGANVASTYVLARWGFGFDVSLWDTATIMAIMVIGIMIPAGPAMAGNFEYFTLRGLALFVVVEGVVGVQAAAFATLLHVLQIVVITLPGFVVMWTDPDARHLVRLSEMAASEEAQNS